ncbi:hypothetical protein QQ096_000850 [Salmonella enterica]|nr:hypothetical protein [Salmonella enterica]
MKKQITENDLREHGFTEKEIARLREILTRPESKNETYLGLINDLGKRFLAGILCLVLIFIPIIPISFLYHRDVLISYIPVLIVCCFVVYVLIPLKMSWKAYKMQRQ